MSIEEIIIKNSYELKKDMFIISKFNIKDIVSKIEEVYSLNKSDSHEANNCPHENTVFQNIRCNVCSDCHVIIEIDV